MILNAIIVAVIGLLIFAAITDLTSRRIPNWVSVAITCAFGLAAIIAPGRIDFMGGLLVGLCVFAVTLVGFALGKVGGGDVKLLTAGALWAGVGGAFDFLLITALAGGGLALIYLSPSTTVIATWVRVIVLRGWSPVANDGPGSVVAHDHLPYGVAIAIGGTYVLAANFLGL